MGIIITNLMILNNMNTRLILVAKDISTCFGSYQNGVVREAPGVRNDILAAMATRIPQAPMLTPVSASNATPTKKYKFIVTVLDKKLV